MVQVEGMGVRPALPGLGPLLIDVTSSSLRRYRGSCMSESREPSRKKAGTIV